MPASQIGIDDRSVAQHGLGRSFRDFPAVRQAARRSIAKRIKSTQSQNMIDALRKVDVRTPPRQQRCKTAPSLDALKPQVARDCDIVKHRKLIEELRILKRFDDAELG